MPFFFILFIVDLWHSLCILYTWVTSSFCLVPRLIYNIYILPMKKGSIVNRLAKKRTEGHTPQVYRKNTKGA